MAQPGANVVLFLVDTLRADRLEPYGGDPRTSVHLRELVEEGTLFEDCRAAAPWTLPSVASLMTGLYPRTHGAQLDGVDRNLDEIEKKPPSSLDASRPQITTLLKRAGYVTYIRATNPFMGFGIDSAFDESLNDYARAQDVVDWGLAKLRSHDRTKPYFLVLHFIDTHDPICVGMGYGEEAVAAMRGPGEQPMHEHHRGWPNPEWTDEEANAFLFHRKRWYDAAIRYVDFELGRFRNELSTLDLGPTFFLYTSDHGEDFAEHKQLDAASGFRDPRPGWLGGSSWLGHGHSLHKSVTHVPFVLAGPTIPRRLRVEARVGLVDVLPTVCELLDLELPEELHGRSLVPAMQRQPFASRAYLAESLAYGREKAAYFDEDGWLLIQPASRAERAQLFDLGTDRAELIDRAGERAELLLRTQGRLRSYGSHLRVGGGRESLLDAGTLELLNAIGYGGGAKSPRASASHSPAEAPKKPPEPEKPREGADDQEN